MLTQKTNWELKKKISEVYGSQTIFSVKTGMSEGYISRIINGHAYLPHRKREVWAKLLFCKPQEIFKDDKFPIN